MSSLIMLLAVTLGADAAVSSSRDQVPDGNPTIKNCLVSVKQDIQVPAQEPGVIAALKVEEGSAVSQGDVLGNVDDSERQIQRQLAKIEHESAEEQAKNDVNVRYAKAASAVAHAEYDQAIDANRRVKETFPEAEVRRLKLAWDRAALQIEQAMLEQRVAGFTAKTKGTEVSATENNIRRRQITSPLDGEVVEVYKHEGEWATPGDAVLRVVRFDILRIEGFLHASKYDPNEILGRNVTVTVDLARGRRVEFQGKVVYASPLVEAGGDYRVWAEVKNRKVDGQWLLRPGLDASMTIHVN